jgi:hypothetical protein
VAIGAALKDDPAATHDFGALINDLNDVMPLSEDGPNWRSDDWRIADANLIDPTKPATLENVQAAPLQDGEPEPFFGAGLCGPPLGPQPLQDGGEREAMIERFEDRFGVSVWTTAPNPLSVWLATLAGTYDGFAIRVEAAGDEKEDALGRLDQLLSNIAGLAEHPHHQDVELEKAQDQPPEPFPPLWWTPAMQSAARAYGRTLYESKLGYGERVKLIFEAAGVPVPPEAALREEREPDPPFRSLSDQLMECEEALASMQRYYEDFREQMLAPIKGIEGASIESMSWDDLLGVAVRNLNHALDLDTGLRKAIELLDADSFDRSEIDPLRRLIAESALPPETGEYPEAPSFVAALHEYERRDYGPRQAPETGEREARNPFCTCAPGGHDSECPVHRDPALGRVEPLRLRIERVTEAQAAVTLSVGAELTLDRASGVVCNQYGTPILRVAAAAAPLQDGEPEPFFGAGLCGPPLGPQPLQDGGERPETWMVDYEHGDDEPQHAVLSWLDDEAKALEVERGAKRADELQPGDVVLEGWKITSCLPRSDGRVTVSAETEDGYRSDRTWPGEKIVALSPPPDEGER